MWRHRARLNWFRDGDRNMRFFHSQDSAQSLKNSIEGNLDPNEVWHEDDGEIEKCFVDYYTKLFISSNPMDFSKITEAMQPKVTQKMNSRLLREFQRGEVLYALKQMSPLKARDLIVCLLSFFSIFGPLCVL